jgi:UDP-glucose 4-epimerase
LEGRLELIQMSCTDLSALDIHPQKIYHLGIPSSSPMYKRNPCLVGEAINGFISVYELARRSGSRVVYASSSSLYNGILPPHREDLAIGVTDYYTEARLAMERMAELYQRLYGIASVGLRFFSVYGPREGSKKQYANMVTQFLWDMKAGKRPLVYGDGTQTRDFTYVLDVVRAMRLAMDSDYHGILNVGTGEAWSFNEVIELLNRMMDLSLEAQYTENPIKNYVLQTLADTAKAERTIGFKSRFGLKEGIGELIRNFLPP